MKVPAINFGFKYSFHKIFIFISEIVQKPKPWASQLSKVTSFGDIQVLCGKIFKSREIYKNATQKFQYAENAIGFVT